MMFIPSIDGVSHCEREFSSDEQMAVGIATTLPERDAQIAHRRKRPGRPVDFGDE